jgi:hypothetical protein
MVNGENAVSRPFQSSFAFENTIIDIDKNKLTK